MKKLVLLFLILISSISEYNAQRAGRLQLGLLSDLLDNRILLYYDVHPTIRYFLTDNIMVGLSGLYSNNVNTADKKYLNTSARWYFEKSPYIQLGLDSNFKGNNRGTLLVGYTSNFGRFWVEPYINITQESQSTLVNIGFGCGLSLN